MSSSFETLAATKFIFALFAAGQPAGAGRLDALGFSSAVIFFVRSPLANSIPDGPNSRRQLPRLKKPCCPLQRENVRRGQIHDVDVSRSRCRRASGIRAEDSQCGILAEGDLRTSE